MNPILPAVLVLPVLLGLGGTRDRIEILERDVSTLKETVLQMRQGQTQVLLELEKLNQRLGVAQDQGMADVEVNHFPE